MVPTKHTEFFFGDFPLVLINFVVNAVDCELRSFLPSEDFWDVFFYVRIAVGLFSL